MLVATLLPPTLLHPACVANMPACILVNSIALTAVACWKGLPEAFQRPQAKGAHESATDVPRFPDKLDEHKEAGARDSSYSCNKAPPFSARDEPEMSISAAVMPAAVSEPTCCPVQPPWVATNYNNLACTSSYHVRDYFATGFLSSSFLDAGVSADVSGEALQAMGDMTDFSVVMTGPPTCRQAPHPWITPMSLADIHSSSLLEASVSANVPGEAPRAMTGVSEVAVVIRGPPTCRQAFIPSVACTCSADIHSSSPLDVGVCFDMPGEAPQAMGDMSEAADNEGGVGNCGQVDSTIGQLPMGWREYLTLSPQLEPSDMWTVAIIINLTLVVVAILGQEVRKRFLKPTGRSPKLQKIGTIHHGNEHSRALTATDGRLATGDPRKGIGIEADLLFSNGRQGFRDFVLHSHMAMGLLRWNGLEAMVDAIASMGRATLRHNEGGGENTHLHVVLHGGSTGEMKEEMRRMIHDNVAVTSRLQRAVKGLVSAVTVWHVTSARIEEIAGSLLSGNSEGFITRLVACAEPPLALLRNPRRGRPLSVEPFLLALEKAMFGKWVEMLTPSTYQLFLYATTRGPLPRTSVHHLQEDARETRVFRLTNRIESASDGSNSSVFAASAEGIAIRAVGICRQPSVVVQETPPPSTADGRVRIPFEERSLIEVVRCREEPLAIPTTISDDGRPDMRYCQVQEVSSGARVVAGDAPIANFCEAVGVDLANRAPESGPHELKGEGVSIGEATAAVVENEGGLVEEMAEMENGASKQKRRLVEGVAQKVRGSNQGGGSLLAPIAAAEEEVGGIVPESQEVGLRPRPLLEQEVRFSKEDETVLLGTGGLLDFFRDMYRGYFAADMVTRTVRFSGQGISRNPESARACLEHGLRVCREDRFQARLWLREAVPIMGALQTSKMRWYWNLPSDLLMVRLEAQKSSNAEDGMVNISKLPSLILMAQSFGCLAHSVKAPLESDPALHTTAAKGAWAPPGRDFSFQTDSAPNLPPKGNSPPKKIDIPIVQLWGLKHCVLAAKFFVKGKMSGQVELSLRLGDEAVAHLRSALQPIKKYRRWITFDIDGGALRVDFRLFQAGQKSISAMTLLQDISSTLQEMKPPFAFRMVEVNNPILMRTLASDNLIADIRREAGVADEVFVIAWWKGTSCLLVWGADGRSDRGVDKVYRLLTKRITRWKTIEVCTAIPSCAFRLPHGTRGTCGTNSTVKADRSKEIMTWPFLTANMSEVVGLDLWLDGSFIRGRVSNGQNRARAQNTLDREVVKLVDMMDSVKPRTTLSSAAKNSASFPHQHGSHLGGLTGPPYPQQFQGGRGPSEETPALCLRYNPTPVSVGRGYSGFFETAAVARREAPVQTKLYHHLHHAVLLPDEERCYRDHSGSTAQQNQLCQATTCVGRAVSALAGQDIEYERGYATTPQNQAHSTTACVGGAASAAVGKHTEYERGLNVRLGAPISSNQQRLITSYVKESPTSPREAGLSGRRGYDGCGRTAVLSLEQRTDAGWMGGVPRSPIIESSLQYHARMQSVPPGEYQSGGANVSRAAFGWELGDDIHQNSAIRGHHAGYPASGVHIPYAATGGAEYRRVHPLSPRGQDFEEPRYPS